MSSQPLNASYTYGGLACTALTIEQLTGEEIHFAAAIRWTGVIDMSDAIGGVDVCVSGDISDAHTGLSLTAGTPHAAGRAKRCSSCASATASATVPTSAASRTSSSSCRRSCASSSPTSVLSNPEVLLRFATTAVGLTRSDRRSSC